MGGMKNFAQKIQVRDDLNTINSWSHTLGGIKRYILREEDECLSSLQEKFPCHKIASQEELLVGNYEENKYPKSFFVAMSKAVEAQEHYIKAREAADAKNAGLHWNEGKSFFSALISYVKSSYYDICYSAPRDKAERKRDIAFAGILGNR